MFFSGLLGNDGGGLIQNKQDSIAYVLKTQSHDGKCAIAGSSKFVIMITVVLPARTELSSWWPFQCKTLELQTFVTTPVFEIVSSGQKQ